MTAQTVLQQNGNGLIFQVFNSPTSCKSVTITNIGTDDATATLDTFQPTALEMTNKITNQSEFPSNIVTPAVVDNV